MALIEHITVGERRREDLGDIGGLAKSIEKHGLLQPIVVDAQMRLVAGERRLRACQSLGWTEIPSRNLGDLSDDERELIELEENIRRKDLTEYELAKHRVRQAIVAEKVLDSKPEVLPDSGKTSLDATSNKGGRPPKGKVSQEKVADYLDMPRQTISTAQTHVATVDRFPFMQSWPQYRVLEAKEYVAKLPEVEHDPIIKLLNQPAIPPEDGVAILKNLAQQKTPEERQVIYALNDSTDSFDRQQALAAAAAKPPMPDRRLGYITEALRAIDTCRRLSTDGFRDRFGLVATNLEAIRLDMGGRNGNGD